jgi:hypothetical protein
VLVVVVTVNVRDAVCVKAPLVPVMVSGELPAGVLDVVVMVKSDSPEPAIVAGLKLAVAPVGNPDTLRLTMSLNPFMGFRYTFEYPTPPPGGRATPIKEGSVVRK